MSTLFFIGNGFDINCGMHTSYKDVYKGYVKEESNSEIIRRFKSDISSNIDNWGDFEMSMATYAARLANEAELLECLRDFARYMEMHLISEVNEIKAKLKDEKISEAVLKEMGNSLASFYYGISHNVDSIMERREARMLKRIEVVSFNYTDIFDVIYSGYMRDNGINGKKVAHIHGLLQDDPVFGVDNIKQVNTIYSLTRKGKRGFIKPIFNTEYDYQRVQYVERLIEGADTICVFGMSLGESDLSWRLKIIEWLRKDANHHLFVYQYSLSEVKAKTVGEKLDVEDDAKEQLMHEWAIEATEEIYEQIHIPCGRNIFNIGNIIEVIELQNEKKKNAEIVKRIEQAKDFVEQHADEIVIV